MQVPKIDCQPSNFGVISFIDTQESGASFSDYSVATINPQPQITTQESYPPISALSIMDRIADVSCQIPNPDNPVSTDNGNVSKSLKRPFPGISGSESEDPANQKRFIVKASKKSQNHVAEKEGESTCNKGYFGKFKARGAFHVHHYRQRFYSYMTGKNDQFPLLSQMQERRCMPVKNEQLQDEQLQDELIKAQKLLVKQSSTIPMAFCFIRLQSLGMKPIPFNLSFRYSQKEIP